MSTSKKDIAQGLAVLLADTYTLYLKTQGFHWNVQGPQFTELHTLFETEYTDLAAANDNIAERIRALGYFAPASYSDFAKLGKIKEETSVPSAFEMIEQLARDNETIVEHIRAIRPLVDNRDDNGTASLLDGRLEVHEKAIWMLRSHLHDAREAPLSGSTADQFAA